MGPKHDQVLHDFVVARSDELCRTAFLMCGDWEVAQNLVQDIMSELVFDRRRGRADDLDGYARRALMDAFHADWRRRFRRRDRFYFASGDEPMGVPDPTLKVSVLAALSELPVRGRAVMVLRHWEALSVRETAETLGVRAGAVKAHDARAVDVLHESLAEHPDIEDLYQPPAEIDQPDAEWFDNDLQNDGTDGTDGGAEQARTIVIEPAAADDSRRAGR